MGTTKTQRGERDGRQRRALARIASAVIQPPPGKTSLKKLLPRQKKFADIWIEGLGRVSMTEAAKQAGFPESRAAVWATELTDPMKYPHVVDYIRRKQAELSERYGTTMEKHMRDLLMIRDRAIEAGAWSAAVQAEYRRGQALGTIYIDRKEIRHGTIDSMSKEEVQRKLEELRKVYAQSPQVVEVEDVKVVESIEIEKGADTPVEEVLDEAGKSFLSADEGWDDEDEANEGGDVGQSGNT